MTLTKAKMVSKIGRRTRLRNADIQLTIETLINLWTEELVSGGRIELENFLVIEVQTIERRSNRLLLNRRFRQITFRVSKALRARLNRESI